ncbi:uncharacterized ATP-dependent helicase C29A10.10c [Daphnia magna]|uniref:uncharacterized ATP-dependent helicase C29A10.10c n=1 Tax=Daphnia magna TaxID=35525 RepID=UPI001E1BC8A6|nr:uncharacterized ATP-dependent helicase C29A10.10c [Daphnia magna]XP_032787317.2 uncharacterized ATP-dependent helicase C29A10.10c [Daphnia magna]XP_032787318.2 uncharacterized ATP-dependent helicase C29A10.10c [Daphnia magna]
MMMGNSKSNRSGENQPSKSKSPDKRSTASTHKTSKKKHVNGHNQDLHQHEESSRHANTVSSNNGSASTSSESQLTRRPLRNNSSKELYETVYAEPNHVPLLVPKKEKPGFHRKTTFHISRDPRMTENPILDHADDMLEDASDETLNQDLTNDFSAPTEPVLDLVVDINVEQVKNEIEDLGLADGSDWKSKFLNVGNTITEEAEKNSDNAGHVRIKTEPMEDHVLPTSKPIEDDRCSVDSGSTVGLPSPERASPTPSCPSPRPSEDNQAMVGQDDYTTLKITPNGQPISSELKNDKPVADSVSENNFPIAGNSSTSYYSPPTDLEEEYRKLEREKIAASLLANKEYSRENTDVSSDEEVSVPTESHSNAPAFHVDDFGDDDDGEQFCDFDQEKDPSWTSPTPPEDSRTGQKRSLPTEEATTINETTVPLSKKNKFQVLKFPQDGVEPSPHPTTITPVEISTSTSTASSSATSSTAETSTPKPSEMEVDVPLSQSATPTNKSSSSTRPRIPVKLTTTNRASMMVEDYLNSANINAARVPNKRAVTPSKTTPKPKKTVRSERSTPSSPSRPVDLEFSESIAGDHGIHEDSPRPQNLVALVSRAQDPRLRRKENETSFMASKPSNTISNLSLTVKNRILMRVLKLWQYKWIEQQAENKEPPPLLEQDRNFPLEIPQLSCVPVLTKYGDLQSYYDIFHPLILHEMWSSLVLKIKEIKEKNCSEWKCLIMTLTKEDAFVLLRCIIILEYEIDAPIANDLVVMKFTRANGEFLHPFGFVESSKTIRLSKISDLDPTLMPKDKSKANYSAEVLIRITKNYAPKNYAPGQKNIICAMAKITSLASFMDLFHAQAAFNFSPLRDIILHPRPFAFQLMHSQRLFQMDYLDPLQTEAYLSIGQTMLITPNDQPKIALLQGFPGTGKTHVAVHIINHLLGHKLHGIRPKILYCAPTHAAVDEMTRRLVKMNRFMEPDARFDVLRMGTWARLHPDIREATLEDKLIRLRARIKQENPARKEVRTLEEKLVLLQNLKQSILKELNQDSHSLQRIEELEQKLAEVTDEIETATVLLEETKKVQEEKVEKDLQDQKHLTISQADVICTTLETCCDTDMQNIFLDRKPDGSGKMPRPFLCCIIDDASLCTEPQTLIPLTLGIKKLILVGDVELSPFILHSSVAKESRLDQSLFSRFHSFLSLECNENERTIFSLNMQHRMDYEICQWTSKYYYGNQLLTSATLKLNTPLHAYRILDVKDSREKSDGSSLINRSEAEVVVKIVESLLLSPDLNERTIGIVTFYEKQRILIRHLIRERRPRDYARTEVRLVQDVQGTETDIVIISCVKTIIRGRDKNLATLTEYWNVALTRATESLFICGHLKTLQANEVLKDLICDADKRQVIHRVSSLFDPSMLYDVLLKPTAYMAM